MSMDSIQRHSRWTPKFPATQWLDSIKASILWSPLTVSMDFSSDPTVKPVESRGIQPFTLLVRLLDLGRDGYQGETRK